MNTKLRKSISLALASVFIMQLAGCGTIMHPERKGQTAGDLDTSIVALNAVGLLFFLVPGVIAYAVDFNNGTIYLPGGSAAINSDDVNIVTIEGEMTNEMIEQVIFEETGKSISVSDSEVQSGNKVMTLSALNTDVKFL
jgi:hypothetical protein